MDYKDKIRKLLALAKSPEPEEAKLALLKARKLVDGPALNRYWRKLLLLGVSMQN